MQESVSESNASPASRLALVQRHLEEAEVRVDALTTALNDRDQDAALVIAVRLRIELAGLGALIDSRDHGSAEMARYKAIEALAAELLPRAPMQIRGLERIERFLRRFGPYNQK